MAIICLCNRVSDRRVRRAVAHGASTRDDVGRACGAGTTCHGCHDTIDDLIAEHQVVPVPVQRPFLVRAG